MRAAIPNDSKHQAGSVPVVRIWAIYTTRAWAGVHDDEESSCLIVPHRKRLARIKIMMAIRRGIMTMMMLLAVIVMPLVVVMMSAMAMMMMMMMMMMMVMMIRMMGMMMMMTTMMVMMMMMMMMVVAMGRTQTETLNVAHG